MYGVEALIYNVCAIAYCDQHFCSAFRAHLFPSVWSYQFLQWIPMNRKTSFHFRCNDRIVFHLEKMDFWWRKTISCRFLLVPNSIEFCTSRSSRYYLSFRIVLSECVGVKDGIGYLLDIWEKKNGKHLMVLRTIHIWRYLPTTNISWKWREVALDYDNNYPWFTRSSPSESDKWYEGQNKGQIEGECHCNSIKCFPFHHLLGIFTIS